MSTEPLGFLLLFFAAWVNRQQADVIAYLREENRALRHKLGDKPVRLSKYWRRRIAVKGRALSRKLLREVASVATPDTILRWYRQLVADKYDGSKNRRPGSGRPRKQQQIRTLVVRMALENVRWGYTRIRGALHNLGIDIGRNTINRILLEHGIEPAPERSKRTPWKTFSRVSLRPDRCRRLLHRRGPHPGRPGPLPRFVCATTARKGGHHGLLDAALLRAGGRSSVRRRRR